MKSKLWQGVTGNLSDILTDNMGSVGQQSVLCEEKTWDACWVYSFALATILFTGKEG